MTSVPLSSLAIVLHPEDDVAVASKSLPVGTVMEYQGGLITAVGRIAPGHKIALRPVRRGGAVTKYGQIIGFANSPIAAGEHVHVHNLSAESFDRAPAIGSACPPPLPAPQERRTFQGY